MGPSGSSPDITTEDIHGVFTQLDEPTTPLTTTEVAEALDCQPEAVENGLHELTQNDRLRVKQVTDSKHVWWQPNVEEADGDHFESQEFDAFVSAVKDYAIFMLDPDGTVVSWNEGAERIKGYPEADIVGEHFSTFYTDAAVEDGLPEANLRAAAKTGHVEDEGWRVREDGSQFWANVAITAVRGDDGQLKGFAKVTRDMTERRAYEQQLQEEHALIEQIFDTAPVGIGVFDANGQFLRANPRLLERHGMEADETPAYSLTSLNVYDATGDPIPEDEWPLSRVVETGAPVADFQCQIEPPNGERQWISINAAPLDRNSDGRDSVIAVVEEITEQKERERQLRRERDQTEQLLRTAPIAIAVQDADGETVLANQRAQAVLGLTEQEIIEDPPDANEWTVYDTDGEVIPKDETPSTRVLETGEAVFNEEVVIDPPNGDEMYFRLNAAPIVDSTGDVERVIVTGEDITELKRREQQLEQRKRELETELSEILGRVSDAFYALDDQWRFVHLNDSAAEIMQRSKDDLLGEPIWEVFPESTDSVYRTHFQQAMDTQEPTTFDVYEEGLDAWLEFNVYPSETGLSIYFEDVSERRERQRQLERSEQRYRTLAEYFPDGLVALFDHDLKYELAAGQGFDRIPVDPDDLEGRPFQDVWDDETVETLEPAFQAALDGEERSVELQYEGREWLFQAVPIADEGGDVIAGMTLAQDITERKERERELAKYETIVETIDDGIYVKDADGYFTMVNDAYAELTGYARDELVGSHASVVVDEDAIDQARAAIGSAPETWPDSPVVEAEIQTAGGDTIPTEGTFATLQTDDNREEVGVVRDITERKKRERKLRHREQRLQRYKEYTDDILDSVDDIFYLLADDGSLQRWNETISEVTGFSDAEIRSMHALEFFAEEEHESISAAIADGFETGSAQVEADVLTKGGQTIPYEFVASTVRDPDGNLMLAGIGRDISDRREYERKLEASNERLEQFAYAASHDLQEPLRMISSYLQLVDERYADELDEDGREFIEYAVDGADRMQNMIQGLLEYSRIETRGDPFEVVDLDAVLADVRKDLQLQIAESNAAITVDPLPDVQGDAEQLRQVFQNLLDNAIEYSGDDPPAIHITAEQQHDEWRISVSDDGIGIDPDQTDRIFEVFQRLHGQEEYTGTGIGLAICRRIVERHGGEIWVDSEPGAGTTVSFTLPAAGSSPE